MDSDSIGTVPIPKPRPRKPSAPPSKPLAPLSQPATAQQDTVRPDIPIKPKVAAKPKPLIAAKPHSKSASADDDTDVQLSKSSREGKVDREEDIENTPGLRRSRPLSVKITEDGIHGKVASELASILGRPRSSSKGLLSPTKYSSPQSDTTTVFDSGGSSPASQISPPRPKPRSIPASPTPAPSEGRSLASPHTHSDDADNSPPMSKGAAQISPEAAVTADAGEDKQPTQRRARRPPPSRPPPPSANRPPRPPNSTPVTKPVSSGADTAERSNGADLAEPRPVSDEGQGHGSDEGQGPGSDEGQGPGIAKGSAVPRKLEITVLGARPMSEVGFRESKGQSIINKEVVAGPVRSHISNPPDRQQQGQQQQVIPKTSKDAGSDMNRNGARDTMNSNPVKPGSQPLPVAEVRVTAASSAVKKPTIIRPSRPAATKVVDHADTDSLVSKETAKPKPTIIRLSQRAGASADPSAKTGTSQAKTAGPTAMQRNSPPQSLDVKKDPWNQVAKGPGPLDNPAFSTGDTPPPKPHGPPRIPSVVPQQKESRDVREGNTLIDFVGKSTKGNAVPGDSRATGSAPTHSIMDQSLEHKFPVNLQPVPSTSPDSDDSKQAESTMFYHSVGLERRPANADQTSDAAPATSKPSALQRIYEYKKAREEKQPEKYKHRPDCYADKPNNDSSFWKPGPPTDSKSGRPTFTPPSSKRDLEKSDKSSPRPLQTNRASEHRQGSANKTSENRSRPRCIAKYDFTAEADSDLSFREGNVIEILEQTSSEWCRGALNGRQGTFPVSFVDILAVEADSDDSEESGDENVPLIAYAAFEYKGAKPGDLSLKAGQEVKVIAKVDSELLYGEAGGKCGVFPALYVSVGEDDIETLPLHDVSPAQTVTKVPSQQAAKAEKVWGTALFDFTAENDTELSLKAGVRVEIEGRVDEEWTLGQVGGHSGIFPTAFIRLDTPS